MEVSIRKCDAQERCYCGMALEIKSCKYYMIIFIVNSFRIIDENYKYSKNDLILNDIKKRL